MQSEVFVIGLFATSCSIKMTKNEERISLSGIEWNKKLKTREEKHCFLYILISELCIFADDKLFLQPIYKLTKL